MANVLSSKDGSGLADVVEIILDKGIVIDVSAEVDLIGINILRIRAKVFIGSADTYIQTCLKYADALGQISLAAPSPALLPAAGA